MQQTKTYKSFKSLSAAINGAKTTPDKWIAFLKEKGHTEQTFNYLPENIQTSLKFSFAKRQQ